MKICSLFFIDFKIFEFRIIFKRTILKNINVI